MTIVDLTKARAWAAVTDHIAADWIRELADEVESLQRALMQERRDGQALAEQLGAAEDERDAALTALAEILGTITKILPGV